MREYQYFLNYTFPDFYKWISIKYGYFIEIINQEVDRVFGNTFIINDEILKVYENYFEEYEEAKRNF